MRLAFGSFLIVNAHGPHKRSKTEEPKAFWDGVVVSVRKAMKPGDRILFITDANAHAHSRENGEMIHAEFFLSAMQRLGLVLNIGEEAMPTYWYDSETSFQK